MMTNTTLVPNGQKLLSFKNVGLCYSRRKHIIYKKTFWALRDITFDLHSGETLGVIGRNGVGKSTLLRIIAGIISPNKGSIEKIRTKLKISLISLQAGFLPFLSGRENALLSGMLLGATKNEMIARMDDILEFSELDEYFDENLGTYSTGMRARLGFSVAYFVSPDIILLDEVLGVGDQSFRKKSTAAMKQRIKSDKTVVLVSHNMPLIREVCDRLLWIENGTTYAQGNVLDVLQEYMNSIKP